MPCFAQHSYQRPQLPERSYHPSSPLPWVPAFLRAPTPLALKSLRPQRSYRHYPLPPLALTSLHPSAPTGPNPFRPRPSRALHPQRSFGPQPLPPLAPSVQAQTRSAQNVSIGHVTWYTLCYSKNMAARRAEGGPQFLAIECWRTPTFLVCVLPETVLHVSGFQSIMSNVSMGSSLGFPKKYNAIRSEVCRSRKQIHSDIRRCK